MDSRKKRLLFLKPGPMHELTGSLRTRLEGLSDRFEGDVVSTASVELPKRVAGFDIRVLRFQLRGKFRTNVKYTAYCLGLALWRRLTGRPWDLVVTYDPIKTGLIGWCVARLSGAAFAPEVNGVYTSYANYLDAIPGLRSTVKRKLILQIVRFTLSRSDGIKVLFPSQVDEFRPSLREPIIAPIFDFVELKPFKNLGEEKEILFVGFPFWLKGVDLLIRAFKNLSPKHPEWRLKILGWYPDQSTLQAHMADHPRISHHPPVHHRDIPSHIGRCAILVLPSRTEAMGRVLLEAMAAGKPRLGARVDGIPTVIDDGVDGLLFRVGDVFDLEEKLESLMADPGLRRRLGDAGQLRAREEFCAKNYLCRLIAFYTRTMERRAA